MKNHYLCPMRIIKTILFSLITGVALNGFAGCKKKDQAKTYTVTYTVTNNAPAYLLSIWSESTDDFQDTVRTASFTKTFTYTTLPIGTGWQVQINNRTGAVSSKKIAITYDGTTTECTDTMYPNLNCQRIPR